MDNGGNRRFSGGGVDISLLRNMGWVLKIRIFYNIFGGVRRSNDLVSCVL